jgi:hypothetical protein
MNVRPTGGDPLRGQLPTSSKGSGPESRTKNRPHVPRGQGFSNRTLHGGSFRRSVDPATGRRQFQRTGLGYDDNPKLPQAGIHPAFEK